MTGVVVPPPSSCQVNMAKKRRAFFGSEPRPKT